MDDATNGPGDLGLPSSVRAVLFDMDGVLTRTADVHAAAWAEVFDAFLAAQAERTGAAFVPFALPDDYRRYVDGRVRADGTRAFLASRGIELPEGSADDPPDALTVHGLGNRKNDRVLARIREHGVDVFEGSVRYLRAVRAAGLPTAVVSASANTAEVLRVTGLESLIDVRMDGVIARERGLPGKPAPDTFLAAAAHLGVAPQEAAVIEDALSGVRAGRAGGFGFVVGVDRQGQSDALRAEGADVVVADLQQLLGEETAR